MKYGKFLIFFLTVSTFFLTGFQNSRVGTGYVLMVVSDSIKPKSKVKINQIPVDSVEALGNLKFVPYNKKAHASYYSDKFNGRRTASGTKFSNKKFTAAHRKLPFGTKLRLTNHANGECVVVEVTDRGPFTKGREIDISKRAFQTIAGGAATGGLTVAIDIIEH